MSDFSIDEDFDRLRRGLLHYEDDAYRYLFDVLLARIAGMLIRAGLSKQQAEEALAATVFKLLEMIEEGETFLELCTIGTLERYLFTMCRNHYRDYCRKRNLEVLEADPEATLRGQADPLQLDPEEALCQADLLSYIEGQVAALPATDFTLVERRFTDKLAYDEISKMDEKGRSPGALRVCIHRIVVRLRSDLEEWEA